MLGIEYILFLLCVRIWILSRAGRDPLWARGLAFELRQLKNFLPSQAKKLYHCMPQTVNQSVQIGSEGLQ